MNSFNLRLDPSILGWKPLNDPYEISINLIFPNSGTWFIRLLPYLWYEFFRRRIGLILTVTPQVNKEGYVTLIVQVSYSDITPSAISLQGATVFDPITRGASTMVRGKNRQTVVIGWMLSSTESKTVKKVPLLGYIPIIGWLFTSVSSRRTNTDLVIFVTPTILVD